MSERTGAFTTNYNERQERAKSITSEERSRINDLLAAGTAKVCGACELAIDSIGPDEYLIASSGFYHSECFVCNNCGVNIKPTETFAEKEGAPYHPSCYIAWWNPSCSVCQKKIDADKDLQVDNSSGIVYCTLCKPKPKVAESSTPNPTPVTASATASAPTSTPAPAPVAMNPTPANPTPAQVPTPAPATASVTTSNPSPSPAPSASASVASPVSGPTPATSSPASIPKVSKTSISIPVSERVPAPGKKFCTSCGTKRAPENKFCTGCGSKF